MLRLLETEAGIKNVEVTEIERQRDAYRYKEAVKALSDGRSQEGFEKLDELGWIHEIGDDAFHQVEEELDWLEMATLRRPE